MFLCFEVYVCLAELAENVGFSVSDFFMAVAYDLAYPLFQALIVNVFYTADAFAWGDQDGLGVPCILEANTALNIIL